jgi:ankyrin repeat protein
VRELLDKHGAELNFLDEATGNTPLLTAAENQKADLARFLVTRGADPHFKNAKKICAAHHDTSLVWFQAQHLEAVRVKEEEEKKRKSRYHTRHSD